MQLKCRLAYLLFLLALAFCVWYFVVELSDEQLNLPSLLGTVGIAHVGCWTPDC